jgi:hypothetical protein
MYTYLIYAAVALEHGILYSGVVLLVFTQHYLSLMQFRCVKRQQRFYFLQTQIRAEADILFYGTNMS